MKSWQLSILAILFICLVFIYFAGQRQQREEGPDIFVSILPNFENQGPDSLKAYWRGSKDKGLVIKKTKDGWLVSVKKEGKKFWTYAKSQKVEKLLHDLSSLTGQLRADDRRYLDDFGLGENQGLQIVLERSGSRLASLVVGKKGPGWGSCFVKKADSSKVYLVSKDILADFDIWSKQMDSPIEIRPWIELTLIKETPFEINEVEYKSGKIHWSLKRGQQKQESKWQLNIGKKSQVIDGNRAQEILSRLFPMRATKPLPKDEFRIKDKAKEEDVLTVKDKNGTLHLLYLPPCNEKEQICLVKDEKGYVFNIAKDIKKDLDEPKKLIKEEDKKGKTFQQKR